jgi:hypothetical protein
VPEIAKRPREGNKEDVSHFISLRNNYFIMYTIAASTTATSDVAISKVRRENRPVLHIQGLAPSMAKKIAGTQIGNAI